MSKPVHLNPKVLFLVGRELAGELGPGPDDGEHEPRNQRIEDQAQAQRIGAL